MDFNKVKDAFEKYVSNYDMSNDMVELKYLHSYRTEELMDLLAKKLNLSDSDTYIAKVIGLLHDIGRFEQVRLFDSCSDNLTKFDHASESCIYLFEKNHIKDFIDIDEYNNIIEKAIEYHNKYEIASNVTSKELLFCKMIRDMDKVDIFKVSSKYYSYNFNYNEISPNILDCFMERKSIYIKDIKSESDRILSKMAFIFDINFKESFEILKSTGNFELFLSSITVDEKNKEKFEELKNICYMKMKGEGC